VGRVVEEAWEAIHSPAPAGGRGPAEGSGDPPALPESGLSQEAAGGGPPSLTLMPTTDAPLPYPKPNVLHRGAAALHVLARFLEGRSGGW
jgi:hypothetical protein